jgi:hypothetical protein
MMTKKPVQTLTSARKKIQSVSALEFQLAKIHQEATDAHAQKGLHSNLFLDGIAKVINKF